MAQIDHALETSARAGRPIERRRVQRQLGSDLVQQGEGIERLAVHLVDEGDDRDVAQAADLEQLQRLRFDALGGVQHHDRGVGGRQRAVGVFGEVLVAGRVQQVEHQAGVVEGHGAGRDRDAALALDLHPVRTRAPLLAARPHRAGRPDRPAGQQQVLGQGGLAGVGMADDRERAPARGLGGGGVEGHHAGDSISGGPLLRKRWPGRKGARYFFLPGVTTNGEAAGAGAALAFLGLRASLLPRFF